MDKEIAISMIRLLDELKLHHKKCIIAGLILEGKPYIERKEELDRIAPQISHLLPDTTTECHKR